MVCWIAWAILVLDTLWTIGAVIVGAVRRIPLEVTDSPTRAATRILLAFLIGTILAITTRLGGAAKASAGPPSPAPAAVALANPHDLLDDTGPLTLRPVQYTASAPVHTDPTGARHSQAAEREYVVRQGDTLWGIAERMTGDPLNWRQIWQANRGTIQPGGGMLTDANRLMPGWRLQLPVAQTSTPPQHTQPEPHRRDHRTGPAHRSTPPEGGGSTATPHAGHGQRGTQRRDEPVFLPGGGTITIGLAGLLVAAVTTAAVLRWRRSYRPRPWRAEPGELSRDLADARSASPEGPVVPEIVGELREQLLDQPSTSPPGPDSGETGAGWRDRPLLVLAGPGAPDATRGELVRRLVEHAGSTHVVAVADHLRHLLQTGADETVPEARNLTVVDGVAEALTVLDVDLMRRAEHDDDDHAGGLPAVGARSVLFCDRIPAEHWQRCVALLAQPGMFTVTGLHGATTAGAIDIDVDGTVDDTDDCAELVSAEDARTILAALSMAPDQPMDSPPDESADASASTRPERVARPRLHVVPPGPAPTSPEQPDRENPKPAHGPASPTTRPDSDTHTGLAAEAITGTDTDVGPGPGPDTDVDTSPGPGIDTGTDPAAARDPGASRQPAPDLSTPDAASSAPGPATPVQPPVDLPAVGAADSPDTPGSEGQQDDVLSLAIPPRAGHARVRLLGVPAVVGQDGRVVAVERARALTIVAWLATRRRTGSTSDEIRAHTMGADQHRGGGDQKRATDLASLRKALATSAAVTDSVAGAWVVLNRASGRYRIDTACVDVDLWHLQDELDAAAGCADPGERARQWETALAGFDGQVLTGMDELWAQEQREAVLTAALDAAMSVADHYAQTDPQRALRMLADAIGWAPFTEALYQRRMRIHAALGDADAVRAAERALTRQLASLNTQPSRETRHLVEHLLHPDRAPQPATRP
ncbi:LysM peptidoglycan-binding domain-containing protein [Actinocatenispora rupis]|uniref:LysM peptidoglycan-binding domain-containing protein n=1 Tax=Actinocatenispora rupis TaxID=519421 RepID=UPI001945A4C9|nr:LysM peptidoglycan-binding domain-containing protein [Actinocatenispora rupis]